MPNYTKELLEELIASTERPSEWVVDEYHAKHTPSGTEFWIANGYSFFHMEEPTTVNFGWIGSWRLWKAIGRLKAHQILVKGERACKS